MLSSCHCNEASKELLDFRLGHLRSHSLKKRWSSSTLGSDLREQFLSDKREIKLFISAFEQNEPKLLVRTFTDHTKSQIGKSIGCLSKAQNINGTCLKTH